LYIGLNQSLPTFFDVFLTLLILELFIPPLWHFHSYPVRVRRFVFRPVAAGFKAWGKNKFLRGKICVFIMCIKQIFLNKTILKIWGDTALERPAMATGLLVLTTTGTVIFADDNNLFNKSEKKLFVK